MTKRWEYYKRKTKVYDDKSYWYWNVLKKHTNFKVPLLKRLKMYKNNFNSDHYVKYNFEKNDMSDYISTIERYQSKRLTVGQYYIILDDKEVFYHCFGDYIKLPKVVGNIINGKLIDNENKEVSIKRVVDMLKKGNGLVFRVKRSYGGNDMYILKYVNDHFEVNGRRMPQKLIKQFIIDRENYIVTEALKNADYSAKIYDDTLNTVRIIIAKEKNSDKYELIAAAHRFGCKESIPGDNLTRGGLVSLVDLKTGKLSKATSSKLDGFVDKHPDTQAQIEGVTIPNFEEVTEDLIKLAYKFSFINYFAWDVVFEEDGYSVIECNSSSGLNLFQYFHGMKKHRLGEIFKTYNVFDKKKKR